MTEVEDVVNKFNILDDTLKHIFPKVDPLLVVSLIFDSKEDKNHIYTLRVGMKPGLNKEVIRQDVINRTGTTPGFYLDGTEMVVSHKLDLDFLKWINDQEGVTSVNGVKFSAGGSSDF